MNLISIVKPLADAATIYRGFLIFMKNIPIHRDFCLKPLVAKVGGLYYTEEWEPLPEYETTYHISSFGRVKKLGRWNHNGKKWLPEKIMAAVRDAKGYLRIRLRKNKKTKGYYVHRIVALAFIPLVEGKPCVNHKTGRKLKNHYTELEWCTDVENNEHGKKLGLFKGANSKISLKRRKFIQENFFIVGRKALAEMFGLTEEYVLAVAKVKVRGTDQRKKMKPRFKKIIDVETGDEFNSAQLAAILKTSRKEINRMLNEERKPNTSQYRYA